MVLANPKYTKGVRLTIEESIARGQLEGTVAEQEGFGAGTSTKFGSFWQQNGSNLTSSAEFHLDNAAMEHSQEDKDKAAALSSKAANEKEAANARKAIRFDDNLLISKNQNGTFIFIWQSEGTEGTNTFPDMETGVQSLLDGETIPKRRETLEKFRKTAEEKNWDYELLQEAYGIKVQW